MLVGKSFANHPSQISSLPFAERSPNEAAWKTLKNLLTYAVQSGYLASDYLLMAHSDVSNTISPGKLIRETIKMWPHYKH